jgi:hypothetical protein
MGIPVNPYVKRAIQYVISSQKTLTKLNTQDKAKADD